MLRIDGRQYSPALLEGIVSAGGLGKSYLSASTILDKLLGFNIAPRQVNNLTVMIGSELQEARDASTETWRERLLTQPKTIAEPVPQLACVQTDGGRMQTRTVGQGTGVHAPHWRETKNAGFFRMATESFESDPREKLPSVFSSRKNMGELLVGLNTASDDWADDALSQTAKPDLSWRPKPLYRSCLSSLASSKEFGVMMAAEADRRGFFTAERRAFLGDGLAYNWSIRRDHFPSFTPILDFIHPIERLYEVSKALESDSEAAWRQAISWIDECWRGNVSEVIGILKAKQIAIGEPLAGADEKDAAVVLAETITYLSNNVSRMNYPAYRQAGLPMTSCLIESQIKEMNYRVKGTEKFWNDGVEAEAILQIRAALLNDDDKLANHFQNRKGSPYARTCKK